MKHYSFRIVFGFGILIFTGTLLLYFDGYKQPDEAKNWIDVIFTAVSAVCVTGLTVLDISKEFSFAGQLIILILIQMGGLGVIAISNWLVLSVLGELNFSHVESSNETMGYLVKMPAANYIKRIIFFTLLTEAFGALFLFFAFLRDHKAAQALWLAVFHSVSAFCNAGFSLFSGSFVGYRSDPVVNMIIAALVIIGGLGFLAIIDFFEFVKVRFSSRRIKLSLSSKIAFLVSLWLILGGMFFIYSLEYRHAFKGQSLGQSLLDSLFLSITSRTAGFNTIPTESLTGMTLVAVIFLMIIGASSGSTGGGIKTSTAAVFWALVKSGFKKSENVEIFSRTVRYRDIAKSVTIILSYLMVMLVAVTLLQITETSGLGAQASRALFLEHLFEVVSALSTVGLSTGVTHTLSDPGKWVIIFCMFSGRVGLLVLLSLVVGPSKKILYKFPSENIMVG